MHAFVKLPAFFTIILFSLNAATAQLKLNLASTISADIKKVIDDYPNHFDHITGEMIIQNPQSTDYQCNFKVDGAEECTITKYTGRNKPVTSWQAVMLTTESFEDAKKKFRSLYTQINNLQLRSMQLKGPYETPAEEKKFTSVVFSFYPSDESLKKLRVELALEAAQMEWKVRVVVYDRDREDDERGETIE
jgi:hypothetical protein